MVYKNKVINSAQVVTVQMEPPRDVERIGQRIQVRFIQLVYNFTHGYVSCEAKGLGVNGMGDPTGRMRTLHYRNRSEFPRWIADLSARNQPTGFTEDIGSPTARSKTKGKWAQDNVEATVAAVSSRKAYNAVVRGKSHPDMIV